MLARQLFTSSVLVASMSPGVKAFAGIGGKRTAAAARFEIFRHCASSTSPTSRKVHRKDWPSAQVLSTIAVTANDGLLTRIRHKSASTKTDMTFSLFLPSAHKKLLLSKGQSLPALYWLSGLTCDDTNFAIKAGAFAAAEREGIALVIPDTSPRGDEVPNDDECEFILLFFSIHFSTLEQLLISTLLTLLRKHLDDLGQGAGFYVDATESPWSENFNMYTYITEELPAVVNRYGVGDVKGVFG